ncbi:hypothetical protein JP75_11510 [Devosia riboflavina]|uniref:Phage tail tape measure protein domain-containing protein n=1 Tax=Devosia riboflavina TaxID=46914 RepID=A0A087M271_9HYPH|nr:phage tail tape measure protein [Devosia riboflavina]KFL30974.1 hypothetical protein JP75_11510 [Devosia riboflavina]
MARLHSELVLGLTDHVSGPARRLNQNLENMRQHHLRNQQAFVDHRNALASTAVAAFALAQAVRVPIQSAIDFESKLEDINQKVGTTKEGLAEIGAAARELGVDTAVGATQMAEALDGLMAGGLDTQTSLAVASPIGKVATAYEADVQEMVSLSTALLTNMDIAAADIEGAFDVMSTGGKLGRFELSDMAGSFEEVTASAQSLRISGKEGLADLTAALQVARMGAGSGSQAVTNLSNYMSKLMAPDAIKKFGEAGVDIVGSVNQAIAEGQSPIEHTIGILDRLTDGGKQDLLGKYFADAEVQKFIRPMIQNLELYREIRAEALGADGVVQADFNSRMGTSGGVLARFEASVEELNLAVGGALLPKLTEFIESVTPMIDGVSKFVTANEELVAAVVQVTAALIGLRMLGAAGGMAAWLAGLGGTAATVATTAATGASLPFTATTAAIASQVYIGGKGVYGGDTPTDPALSPSENLRNSIRNDLANGRLNPNSLFGIDFGDAVQQNINNPQGGIGGGYTGATSGQIEAMKAEIATLDAEIAEWPEEGMEERRARLAETLARMEAELAASGSAVTIQFGALMEQLRFMAAQGVSIPISMGGPNLGAIAPPPGPRIGAQPPAGNTTTVGDVSVIVQNPTNANPQQIGRQVGQEVADRVRAAHSNGGMD